MKRLVKAAKQKGQDIIEYALLLALVVGVGAGIYASGGLPDSISSIFGGASSLMETAANGGVSKQALTILQKLVKAKGETTSALNTGNTVYGSYNGNEISRKLNVLGDMQERNGSSKDAWFVYSDGDNTYTVYYDPADNNGINFSDAKKPADKTDGNAAKLAKIDAVNISYARTDANGNTTYSTGKGYFKATDRSKSNVNYYLSTTPYNS